MSAQEAKGTDRPETAHEPVGLVKLLGMTLLSATASEVRAELAITPAHYQPMGIVHGGVYCALIETVCSVGGHMHAAQRGFTVVGVDNQTSFLKATREGVLSVRAVPLSAGRRTQLWQADIHDAAGALVATGRVRLIAIDPQQPIAGAAPNAR